MAAYTTSAIVDAEIGGTLSTSMQDLDDDAGDDSAVIAQRIAFAGTRIDARLGTRWSVPFAAITDDPATPTIIQLIATYLVAATLIVARGGTTDQQKWYASEAEKLLATLQIGGTATITGATELDADEAAVGLDFDDTEPTFAGHDDDLDDRAQSW